LNWDEYKYVLSFLPLSKTSNNIKIMQPNITFWGAAGTVTGSKYIITYGKSTVLVDAGLFQGPKEWTAKNWDSCPIDLQDINAVVLTHAHIDHTGILPRLFSTGLECPVWCTPATADLSRMLLSDSGRIQEEEAEYRLRKQASRYKPPLPLYTEKDALRALRYFKPVQFGQKIEVAPNIFATWTDSGHILGAASINLEMGEKLITFSGDIGRYNDPVVGAPKPLTYGNLLLIESTYGDKLHSVSNVKDTLRDAINGAVSRNGMVLIPSFAMGRTQALLYYIRELKAAGQIANIPVFVDSPMATDATDIYRRYAGELGNGVKAILNEGGSPFSFPRLHYTRERRESIEINSLDEPMIVISASGMLNAGRVLHHLRHRVSDSRNTVLFVGFQPSGSKGAHLIGGGDTVRIFHETLPVRAHIASVDGLSGHADKEELLQWCKAGHGKPDRVAVVHGELESATAFAIELRKKLNWNVQQPTFRENWIL
jgi:metallo-beta-lactamase family protein